MSNFGGCNLQGVTSPRTRFDTPDASRCFSSTSKIIGEVGQRWLVNQPTPDPGHLPTRNEIGVFHSRPELKESSAWVFISPDHKGGYFWGWYLRGVGWLAMERSQWEGVSAVWNGMVFLCFCSGLPRSGEPPNDICKVELQFSLSLYIFMSIIRYTVYIWSYIPILWYAYRTLHPQKGSTKFDGSLELDLKKWQVSTVGKVMYHLQGSSQTIQAPPHPIVHPSSMWKA